MGRPELRIYVVHAAFWLVFVGARRVLGARRSEGTTSASTASVERTAPFSRALLALHMLAFGVMYFGLGQTVIPERVPSLFRGQRVVGTAVIACGAALMVWALAYFRSWRFRAKVDEGHQLATGGPFRHLRHPLYMGLNLLALGSALWAPTTLTWAGLVLMVIGSDLRGRAEEKLLEGTFGEPYRVYCARTRRFLPGLY